MKQKYYYISEDYPLWSDDKPPDTQSSEKVGFNTETFFLLIYRKLYDYQTISD